MSVCGTGDALMVLGVAADPTIVSLLNRWGYDRCSKRINWIAKQVGSREIAEQALAMSVGSKEMKAVRSRGLGDTVAKVTKAVGIKPCVGCERRRKLLNKLVPYKD